MKNKFSLWKRSSNVEIRYTKPEDKPYLIQWLKQPGVLRYFPPQTDSEIEHTIGVWMQYAKYHCSITAVMDGKPVGAAILYLSPFKKMAHHSLYGVLVDEEYRSQGIGTRLIRTLEGMAKDLGLEFLHIEVYVGNRALRLYERLGYKEFGRKTQFFKDEGEYIDQIMLQKDLI